MSNSYNNLFASIEGGIGSQSLITQQPTGQYGPNQMQQFTICNQPIDLQQHQAKLGDLPNQKLVHLQGQPLAQQHLLGANVQIQLNNASQAQAVNIQQRVPMSMHMQQPISQSLPQSEGRLPQSELFQPFRKMPYSISTSQHQVPSDQRFNMPLSKPQHNRQVPSIAVQPIQQQNQLGQSIESTQINRSGFSLSPTLQAFSALM